MSAQILDGKAIATELKAQIRAQIEQRLGQGLSRPGLAVVLIGDDPASHVYVRNKRQSSEDCGFLSVAHTLSAETSERELLDLIGQLNADANIDGILVQLPLPQSIDTGIVIEHIDPTKDVDGFHPVNMGRLAQGAAGLRPCTPRGIMTMLGKTGLELAGLDAVVIGRSNIVGRPMALELLAAGCTVTICHSQTRDIGAKVKRADIVVSAVGKPGFVSADWIKPGAIVIDVGINRTADGKLAGDVDFASVKEVASWITPVPGGVGPMTIATLLENTLQAAVARDSTRPAREQTG